jgi:hypothetical protein
MEAVTQFKLPWRLLREFYKALAQLIFTLFVLLFLFARRFAFLFTRW